MLCRECKNKGFIPTDEVPNPIKNVGNKQKYASFDTRQYICLQCGHSFLTKEEYYRPVKVRVQADLFDQASTT